MAHSISDVSNRGYFYHEDDSTQLKTAQRSTFQATTSNKISNFLLSKNNENLQKIGSGLKSLRQADLSIRGASTDASKGFQRFAVKMGATIDMVRVLGDTEATLDVALRRDRKLNSIDERAALKKIRLDWKSKINAAAPSDMTQTVEQANEMLQKHLTEKKYRPLENLSSITPKKNVPIFMRNDSGHRVRTSDQNVPVIARKVAESRSRDYESGVTGAKRAIKSGGQHAVIAASNILEGGKQALYSVAAKIVPGESEERSTYERHAERARDARCLNSAALKGNQVFADKFEQIQNEQAAVRSAVLAASGYEEVAAQYDVAPAKTRYLDRKMNDYFGSADGANKPQIRKLASACVELKNLSPYLLRGYHSHKIKWLDRQPDTSTQQVRKGRHEAKHFNAQFKIDTSRAALDGKLKDVVHGTNQRGVDDSEIPSTAQS